MRTRIQTLLAAAVAAITIAGCSSSPGTPTSVPAIGSTTPSAQQQDRSTATQADDNTDKTADDNDDGDTTDDQTQPTGGDDESAGQDTPGDDDTTADDDGATDEEGGTTEAPAGGDDDVPKVSHIDIELQIQDRLGDKYQDLQFADIECPDLRAEMDASVTCTLTIPGDDATHHILVTVTDIKDSKVSYDVKAVD